MAKGRVKKKKAAQARQMAKVRKPTARVVVPLAALEDLHGVDPRAAAVLAVVDTEAECPVVEIPIPPTAFQKLVAFVRGY